MPTRAICAWVMTRGSGQRNSTLPFWPVIGDGVDATRVNPTSAAAATTSSSTRAWIAGSRMMPLRTSSRPASNCGFTSATTSAPGCSTDGMTGRMRRQGDEGHVDGHEVHRAGQHVERQVARVDVLEDHDARILPQPPVQLAVADVERDHARRAALQHHVGEAAGRGADVEPFAAGDRRSERCRARARASARRGRRTDDPARRARRPRSSSTAVPALVTVLPSTVTCPAMTNARARSRDGASCRSSIN